MSESNGDALKRIQARIQAQREADQLKALRAKEKHDRKQARKANKAARGKRDTR
jgi:hypothetical protein